MPVHRRTNVNAVLRGPVPMPQKGRQLTPEQREWVRDRAAAHPDHTPTYIARMFFRTFGRDVTPTAIKRLLESKP